MRNRRRLRGKYFIKNLPEFSAKNSQCLRGVLPCKISKQQNAPVHLWSCLPNRSREREKEKEIDGIDKKINETMERFVSPNPNDPNELPSNALPPTSPPPLYARDSSARSFVQFLHNQVESSNRADRSQQSTTRVNLRWSRLEFPIWRIYLLCWLVNRTDRKEERETEWMGIETVENSFGETLRHR